MTRYNPLHIDEFGLIARTWHEERDSNIPITQSFRQRELAVGHRLLEEEIKRHAAHRMKIVLHVGGEALSAITFRKTTYGFSEQNAAEMEPGSQIDLTRIVSGWSSEDQARQPYYGRRAFVNFAAIAKTLSQQGRIESTSIDAADCAASEAELEQKTS